MSARGARTSSAPQGAGPDWRHTRLDRRQMVQGSLAALAGTRLARAHATTRQGDELRLAVAGLGDRGAELVQALRALPGVRITALCDVDDFALARETHRLREGTREPGGHSDFRRLLERDDVDAIALATPDHWHALQTVWACQAGKDVFVESPVTHAFAEGARMVAAAAKHARVVQGGLQARANPGLRAAIEWLRAGNLGAPTLARALCYVPQPSIGKTKGNRRIPEIVDYDLWCGPAPLAPLRRTKLHSDWRWFYAYGDGELGDRGAHVLDLARWALGAGGVPASVQSLGARLGYGDDGETPNTQLVHYAFEPAPILLEVRGLPSGKAAQAGDWGAGMDDLLGVRVGVVVHCAQGTLRLHVDGAAIAYDDEGKEIRRWEERGDLLAEWIEACRSRKSEGLAAGIEIAAQSSGLVQLGSASQRLGRGLVRDDLLAELKHAEPMTTTTQRLFAHLDQNGVDLARAEVALGPRLVLDPGLGCVRDDARANALLAGSYREPFVLPES